MATPQVQNDPIYTLPFLYIQGMNISIASTTMLAIAPGQCRDSTDTIDMPVGYPNLQGATLPAIQYQNYMPGLLINSAVNGANGLDQGTIAASTQYAVYVIGDSRGYNPVAGLLSLTSNSAPKLPLGYDSMRLIGFQATGGSSTFVYSTSKPQNYAANGLRYVLQPPVSVLSGGNATTFTAIDMSGAIPTTTLQNIVVHLLVTFTPAAANDVVQFRPTGSSATTNLRNIVGVAAGIAQTQYIAVIAGVGSSKPEIDYLVTSSSDAVSISVVSWTGVSNTAYPALV